MMKSSYEQLRSRGYVEDIELEFYQNLSKDKLLRLLHSNIAANRTIAARTLIKCKDIEIAEVLLSRLIVEKKLYTKIALSESLAYYGERICPQLIEHLGKIGNNQYRELPDKPFGKNNYPLPRDIISRTMCKIGTPALKYLKQCLHTGRYEQILEAIDAIGYISFYSNENSSLKDIMILINKYNDDNIMIWKLLRALQSFVDKEAISIRKTYLNSSIEQHKWEAARSIRKYHHSDVLKPSSLEV